MFEDRAIRALDKLLHIDYAYRLKEILQNPGQPTLRGARLIETMCPHEAS